MHRLFICLSIISLSACRFDFDRELEHGEIRGRVVYVDVDNQRLVAPRAWVKVEGSAVSTRADTEGHFVLRDVPEGRYSLVFEHENERGLRLRDVNVVRARDLGDVVIGSYGAVDGKVVGDEANQSARVVLDDTHATPVEAGQWQFSPLTPGNYTAFLEFVDGRVFAGPEIVVKPRERLEVTLDASALEPLKNGQVSGAVRLMGGGSPKGSTVTFDGPSRAVSTTNGSGEYTSQALVAGVYTVRARHEGFESVVRENVVLKAGIRLQDFLLVPGTDTPFCEGAFPDDECEVEPEPVCGYEIPDNGQDDDCDGLTDEEPIEVGAELYTENTQFTLKSTQTNLEYVEVVTALHSTLGGTYAFGQGKLRPFDGEEEIAGVEMEPEGKKLRIRIPVEAFDLVARNPTVFTLEVFALRDDGETVRTETNMIVKVLPARVGLAVVNDEVYALLPTYAMPLSLAQVAVHYVDSNYSFLLGDEVAPGVWHLTRATSHTYTPQLNEVPYLMHFSRGSFGPELRGEASYFTRFGESVERVGYSVCEAFAHPSVRETSLFLITADADGNPLTDPQDLAAIDVFSLQGL